MPLPQKVPNLRVVKGKLPHPMPLPSAKGALANGGRHSFLDRCRQRWRLLSGTVLVSFLATVTYVVLNPPSYEARFRLLVEPTRTTLPDSPAAATEGIAGTLPESQPALPPPIPTQSDVETQIVVLGSDKVLAPVAEQMQTSTHDLSQRLTIRPVRPTEAEPAKVLEVTYRDRDPERVSAVLHALAETFMAYGQRDRHQQLERTLSQINKDIEQYLTELEQLQRDLQAVQPTGASLQPSEQMRLLTEQYRQIHSLRQAARLKAVEAYGRFQGLQQQLNMTPAEALAAANLSASPAYQQQLAQIQDVDRQIAENLAIFREGTPILLALEEQRNALVAQLQTIAAEVIGEQYRVENPTALGFQGAVSQTLITNYLMAWIEYDTQQRYDAELATPQAAIARELQQLSSQLPKLGRIENRIRTAHHSLEGLNKARQAVQLQLAQDNFAWQLLTDIDNTPVIPTVSRLHLLLLGAIASITVGVLVVVIADALDNTFSSVEQVQATLKLPLLGRIPTAEGQPNIRLEQIAKIGNVAWRVTQVLPAIGDYEQVQEAFHHLYANLALAGHGRSLAIISPSHGEGRTSVALSLALAATATGKNVLLIDGDLRRPALHRYLGLNDGQGLADLLAQGEASDRLAPQAGLTILTAGQLRQHPVHLLSHESLTRFMGAIADRFDWVIVDTPPLLSAVDAKLWSAVVDQTLLVLKLHQSSPMNVRRALQESFFTTDLLGVVVRE